MAQCKNEELETIIKLMESYSKSFDPSNRPQDNAIGQYKPIDLYGGKVWAFIPNNFPPKKELWLDESVAYAMANALDALGFARETFKKKKGGYQLNLVEAWYSARIEGYEASMEDVLLARHTDLRASVKELRKSLETWHIFDSMTGSTDPRRLHASMFSYSRRGVDEESIMPDAGNYRTVPCWIGGPCPSMAVYVPPTPEEVPALMDTLISYIHDYKYDVVPTILKAGLVHAQFENIHPFRDGNGRVGRELINSIFASNYYSFVAGPISKVFYDKRQKYYNALNSVRETGSYITWLTYFFNCVTESCYLYVEHLSSLDAIIEDLKTHVAEHVTKDYFNVAFNAICPRLSNYGRISRGDLRVYGDPQREKMLDLLGKLTEAGIVESKELGDVQCWEYKPVLDFFYGIESREETVAANPTEHC